MRPAWSRWMGIALVWVACSCGLSPLWAQDLQPVPPLAARVLDATGTLDASQRQALEAKLAEIEQAKGSQVVILMVPTTAPEDIASYANRVGNTWKIGRKEVGDGVLVVVALGDRKVRIEVAKTLEGAIPDLAARQIIERAITPRFRLGDFAGGLDAAVDQIGARIKGEPLPPVNEATGAEAGQGSDKGFQLFDLAIFLFIAVPVIGAVTRGIFGRKLGALLTGGGVGALALWITSSLLLAALAALAALLFSLFSSFKAASSSRGWGTGGGGWSSGHGSWGSGGGGGFGSGGGGDFGGGGASGDW